MLGVGTDHPKVAGRALPRRWVILAAAFVIALVGLIGVGVFLHAPEQRTDGYGAPAIGGPFRLTNQHGERVTSKDFAGKYMLIYFGYTFCPDFCPMSLSSMSAALDELSPGETARVVPIFITVDPERDTVEQLAEYAPLFHPELVALTGTDAEVKAAARAYRIYAKKGTEGRDDGSYPVDHSTFMYLMGPDGRYVTHFGHGTSPDEIANRLRAELRD